MKLRRLWAIALIMVLLVTTAGCQDNKQSSSKSSSGAKKTITIAARDGSYSDVINATKGSFELSHNCNIEVIALSSDDIHDTAIEDASNTIGKYDIIMIDDPLMPEYISRNMLSNLTLMGYADDDDFVEKSRLLGKDPYPLGATYAIPFSGNVQLLFYNKDVIGSDANLTNWEEIYNACLNAQNKGKKGYAIRGQAGNPIVSDFLPILWAFGGDIFDENNYVSIDSKESREALEFYLKLYKTGDIYDKAGLVKAVSSGEAGIALGWPSWFISGDGPSASLEQIPGKVTASSEALTTGEIGNWLMGVTNNSSEKELALEAIIYLTSKDVQREALAYGGVPTRKSIFKAQDVKTQYPYFEAIYSGTNNSRVRPRTAKWFRIEEVFGEELMKCINGEQDVNTTISNSQKAIEALAAEK